MTTSDYYTVDLPLKLVQSVRAVAASIQRGPQPSCRAEELMVILAAHIPEPTALDILATEDGWSYAREGVLSWTNETSDAYVTVGLRARDTGDGYAIVCGEYGNGTTFYRLTEDEAARLARSLKEALTQ